MQEIPIWNCCSTLQYPHRYRRLTVVHVDSNTDSGVVCLGNCDGRGSWYGNLARSLTKRSDEGTIMINLWPICSVILLS